MLDVLDDCEVWGPYLDTNDRYYVVLKFFDGTTSTTPYHRYIMQKHLGRELDPNEHVHHIDGDYQNNKISNLTVMRSSDHIKGHKKNKPEEFICPECGKVFTLEGKRLTTYKQNKKKSPNYSGPFCSNSCAGKYGYRRRKENEKRSD